MSGTSLTSRRRSSPFSNRKLYRAQRLSALVFSGFLALHLFAVSGALFSAAVFDRLLDATRLLYGYLPVELGLLFALVIHVGASLILWKRRPVDAPRPLGTQVQSIAGFLLLVSIGGHVAATRILPAMSGFQADATYVWIALAIWPTFFVPYYAALGVAGALHLLYGLRFLLGKKPVPHWHLIAVLVVSAIFLAVPVRILVEPRAEPTPDEIRLYLEPFDRGIPWLMGAADEHPYVIQYRQMTRAEKDAAGGGDTGRGH